MNATDYDWNIEIDVGGVTFHGPGMETEQEARSVGSIVEQTSDVEVEVVRQ